MGLGWVLRALCQLDPMDYLFEMFFLQTELRIKGVLPSKEGEKKKTYKSCEETFGPSVGVENAKQITEHFPTLLFSNVPLFSGSRVPFAQGEVGVFGWCELWWPMGCWPTPPYYVLCSQH